MSSDLKDAKVASSNLLEVKVKSAKPTKRKQTESIVSSISSTEPKLKKAKQLPKKSVSSQSDPSRMNAIMSFLYKPRESRKDKVNLEPVGQWWFDSPHVQLGKPGQKTCVMLNGKKEVHKHRKLTIPVKSLLEIYLKEAQDNPKLPVVGLTLFRKAKCSCIACDLKA